MVGAGRMAGADALHGLTRALAGQVGQWPASRWCARRSAIERFHSATSSVFLCQVMFFVLDGLVRSGLLQRPPCM